MYENLKKLIEQLETIEIKNYNTGKEARYLLQQIKLESQALRIKILEMNKTKIYNTTN
jgi:hypothetical protein